MALLSLNLPVIGQSSATEDQKVRDALAALQADYNGNVTDANVAAAAGIQESKLATGVNGMARGAFRVWRNTALSVVTTGQVLFEVETFDVSSWYDNATNFQYKPLVAGYYRLSAHTSSNVVLAAGQFWHTSIFKNSVEETRFPSGMQSGASGLVGSGGSTLVQANGSTDVFDVRVIHNIGASSAVFVGQPFCQFAGELVGRS